MFRSSPQLVHGALGTAWALPPPALTAIMHQHPRRGVRLLAWSTIRHWARMCDVDSDCLRKAAIPTSDPLHDPPLASGFDELASDDTVVIDGRTVDGWVLDEETPESRAPAPNPRVYLGELAAANALPRGVISVAGVLVPAPSTAAGEPAEQSTFADVGSATDTLRATAEAVTDRCPTLLCGPPASGKSACLNELHRRLYGSAADPVVVLNMADRSIDARVLLGALASSPTDDGAFRVVEGALLRAVRLGRWVVLEDLDKASDDVLALIDTLAGKMRRTARDAIGGAFGGFGNSGPGIWAHGRWTAAGRDFVLFATMSSSERPSFRGSSHWRIVNHRQPDRAECAAIVKHHAPRLSADVVDLLMIVRNTIGQSVRSRPLSIRDVIKCAVERTTLTTQARPTHRSGRRQRACKRAHRQPENTG